jgi:hypothetical protein
VLTFLAIARKQKFLSIDTRDEVVDYMEKNLGGVRALTLVVRADEVIE